MVTQLGLMFEDWERPEEKEKIIIPLRERYDIPTYLKFYTIYQYDRNKFQKLLKVWLQTDEGKERTLETLKAKQNEILELCYLKDEQGNKLRDSDEKHIFRYKTLVKICELLYYQVNPDIFCTYYEQDGLRVYKDIYTKEDYEYQGKIYKGQQFENVGASVLNTEELPIKYRVIIHIRLLRLLRKGLTVKEALCQIKK